MSVTVDRIPTGVRGWVKGLGLLPTLYPKRLGIILLAALLLKLSITMWNAFSYDIKHQYDSPRHALRTGTCGLYTDTLYYNPPLYYMAGCPAMALGLLSQIDINDQILTPLSRGDSLDSIKNTLRDTVDYLSIVDASGGQLLRLINWGMLTAVYGIWIFVLFPRFLGPGFMAFAASLMLLALPGYQKIGAMVNSDNLFVFLTTVSFLLYVGLLDKARITVRDMVIMGLTIGALGLTRPFAVIPMVLIGGGIAFRLWRSAGFTLRPLQLAPLLGRYAVFAVLVVALSSSWWIYRQAVTGDAFKRYPDDYTEVIAPHVKAAYVDKFDHGRFYSTFHIRELLEMPNRLYDQVRKDTPDPSVEPWQQTLNHSFATLMFSDFWADHWLYFSGPQKRETDANVPFKRAILIYALFITPIMLVMGAVGLVRLGIQAARSGDLEEKGVLVLMSALSIALYVCWQATEGMEPGKNTSVKFIYVAYFMPFFIAAMFAAPLRRFVPDRVTTTALLVLLALALPVSLWRW
ncbi:MAG: hypothetical protein ACFB6R_02985 [Alphaproteobacteria bacterium]